MSVDTVKMTTDALKIGMYISKIDRPWTETPFPMQGFKIVSHQQLEILQQLCTWVEIDRHSVSRLTNSSTRPKPVTPFQLNRKKQHAINPLEKYLRNTKASRPYQVSTPLKDEIRSARRLYKRIEERIKMVIKGLSSDSKLRPRQLHNASKELTESVIRNPNAFIYLTRMELKHPSVLNYSIRIATWAILFGRQLNLSRDVLNEIALAAILCKIGYITLPKELFAIQGTPSPQEHEMLKVSLLSGIKLIRGSDTFSNNIVKGVASHMERYDGSGFPDGLSVTDTPLIAQMVGIAAHYEELTSHDFCDSPLAPSDAIRQLYKQRNQLFADYIVEAFIQAIGLYPTGSRVMLNDNREAVVVEQNDQIRLQPKVILIHQETRWWQLGKPKVIDLAKQPKTAKTRIIASLPAMSAVNTELTPA